MFRYLLCWSVRFALLRFLVFMLISQLAFRIFRCSSSWSVRFAWLFLFFVFIFARTFRIAPFLQYRTVLFVLLFVFFCFVLILERTFRIAVFLWSRSCVFLFLCSSRSVRSCFLPAKKGTGGGAPVCNRPGRGTGAGGRP